MSGAYFWLAWLFTNTVVWLSWLRTRSIQNICYKRNSAAKDEVLLFWYSQVVGRGLGTSKSFRSSPPQSSFEGNLWTACLSEPRGLQATPDHLSQTRHSRKAVIGWIWDCTERFAVCSRWLIWPWKWPWCNLEETDHMYPSGPNQDLCYSFTAMGLHMADFGTCHSETIGWRVLAT